MNQSRFTWIKIQYRQPLSGGSASTGLLRLLAGGGNPPTGGEGRQCASSFALMPRIPVLAPTSFTGSGKRGFSIEPSIEVSP